ncbi:MAG: DUF2309 domain-containing protein [Halobacteria archaeon]|nr:DUF2309 domain-containing protein [Halobacteria archaeon]
MSTETDTDIHGSIEATADKVGSVWPLHSFVTANPLSGFEDQPFHEAVEEGARLFGGDGYPSAEVFRRAWENGDIETELLKTKLVEHGYAPDPEATLGRIAESESDVYSASDDTTADEESATERVDRLLTKWLSVFLDQGKAHWSMPSREEGFYTAFLTVARNDGEVPNTKRLTELSTDPAEAISEILSEYPRSEWQTVFEYHLTALPGWTGFIKQRIDDGDSWQSAYPITLTEYVAARLVLADIVDAPIHPEEASDPRFLDDANPTQTDTYDDSVTLPLPAVWLSAWEATYRNQLVDAVSEESESLEQSRSSTSTSTSTSTDGDSHRPDAQLVFCIDTRSEIIRRHIEATGDYETHGYAGFFGVPMRYKGYNTDVAADACPPIVETQHYIVDSPSDTGNQERIAHDHWTNLFGAATDLLKTLKGNAATVFNFVEATGSGYGPMLATRTLLPRRVYDFLETKDDFVPNHHEFCELSVGNQCLSDGLTLDDKVEYATTAFELMGWEEFSRLVVFVGHASETTNNPFGSSLDCGACAGNPGGPNARVLATVCNDNAVQEELRDLGFEIPDDTVFVAGEHNTTTDEIELYTDGVPESHEAELEQLSEDLATARAGAASERYSDSDSGGIRETERRSADWAETRPEWGLAGNASFVIGPRQLTSGLDLDGRAFLHSYDWSTDPDGDALEAIMTGPMVVTQWINSQYYFAAVDTAVYGSGSKVTHNPVGNIGVYQGNGGDLMTGLPLQSLRKSDDELYHKPLRLSTVIHAPLERVNQVLSDHKEVTQLLDNSWLSLTVVDPTQGHRAFDYEGEFDWTSVSGETRSKPESDSEPEVTDSRIAADD